MNSFEPVYRTAHYCVFANPGFVLRIGEQSSPLENFYRQHNVKSAAFITAWNPYGQKIAEADNRERNARLAATIHDTGFAFFPGIGKSPDDKWIGEDSFLVLGITREAAFNIGKQCEQNAIVFCGENAVSELVWIDGEWMH